MNLPSSIKGILFDFDGTLAKTMQDHYKAWQHSLEQYGISLTEEEYYPLEGMSIYEIAILCCKKYNIPEQEVHQIVQRKKEHYITNNTCTLYPEVENIIQKLKQKKIKLGIVTASIPEQLHNSVSSEFLAQFDVIVTGDKTSKGKPHPDPYLKGLELLNLSQNECIVVENAPLGIKSAKNAGIYCIAVTHTVNKEKLQEADEVIETFSNLRLIKKLHSIFKNN